MRTTRASVAWAVSSLTILLLCQMAFAQGGAGKEASPARVYDTKTVETLAGEVVAVERIPSRKGRSGGVHWMLKTDKEEIEVHAGPQWYLDVQPVKVAAHDRVEVRGSRISLDGKPVLIAAEVRRGDRALKLRDDAGLPVWRGRGRMKR